MSNDLKHATVTVMPLGGKNAEATIAALKANAKLLRAMVAQRVNLKFAPELRFDLDHTFAAHDAIDALLRSPRVARDLRPNDEDEGDR
jgi:ribosome-binding factor A